MAGDLTDYLKSPFITYGENLTAQFLAIVKDTGEDGLEAQKVHDLIFSLTTPFKIATIIGSGMTLSFVIIIPHSTNSKLFITIESIFAVIFGLMVKDVSHIYSILREEQNWAVTKKLNDKKISFDEFMVMVQNILLKVKSRTWIIGPYNDQRILGAVSLLKKHPFATLLTSLGSGPSEIFKSLFSGKDNIAAIK